MRSVERTELNRFNKKTAAIEALDFMVKVSQPKSGTTAKIGRLKSVTVSCLHKNKTG